jgi:hypothetical protein
MAATVRTFEIFGREVGQGLGRSSRIQNWQTMKDTSQLEAVGASSSRKPVMKQSAVEKLAGTLATYTVMGCDRGAI